MNKYDKPYWTDRYLHSDTPWDIGYISTPLKEYIDQLQDKNLKILIPGAGNAHEAAYLWSNGFKTIDILDIAKKPLTKFIISNPDFPRNQLIHADFFSLKKKYDLIFEQTFFCALSPELRLNYAKKMSELLVNSGKLVGLLFDFPLQPDAGPPFGGTINDYRELFSNYFRIIKLERAYNSIKQRQNKELFFIFKKL